jgi:hypothetical protein
MRSSVTVILIVAPLFFPTFTADAADTQPVLHVSEIVLPAYPPLFFFNFRIFEFYHLAAPNAHHVVVVPVAHDVLVVRPAAALEHLLY